MSQNKLTELAPDHDPTEHVLTRRLTRQNCGPSALARSRRIGHHALVAGIRIGPGYFGWRPWAYRLLFFFALAAVAGGVWWLLVPAAALALISTRVLFSRCWVRGDVLRYRGVFISFAMKRDQIAKFSTVDVFGGTGLPPVIGTRVRTVCALQPDGSSRMLGITGRR